jgi:hypothetical protein
VLNKLCLVRDDNNEIFKFDALDEDAVQFLVPPFQRPIGRSIVEYVKNEMYKNPNKCPLTYLFTVDTSPRSFLKSRKPASKKKYPAMVVGGQHTLTAIREIYKEKPELITSHDNLRFMFGRVFGMANLFLFEEKFSKALECSVGDEPEAGVDPCNDLIRTFKNSDAVKEELVSKAQAFQLLSAEEFCVVPTVVMAHMMLRTEHNEIAASGTPEDLSGKLRTCRALYVKHKDELEYAEGDGDDVPTEFRAGVMHTMKITSISTFKDYYALISMPDELFNLVISVLEKDSILGLLDHKLGKGKQKPVVNVKILVQVGKMRMEDALDVLNGLEHLDLKFGDLNDLLMKYKSVDLLGKAALTFIGAYALNVLETLRPQWQQLKPNDRPPIWRDGSPVAKHAKITFNKEEFPYGPKAAIDKLAWETIQLGTLCWKEVDDLAMLKKSEIPKFEKAHNRMVGNLEDVTNETGRFHYSVKNWLYKLKSEFLSLQQGVLKTVETEQKNCVEIPAISGNKYRPPCLPPVQTSHFVVACEDTSNSEKLTNALSTIPESPGSMSIVLVDWAPLNRNKISLFLTVARNVLARWLTPSAIFVV